LIDYPQKIEVISRYWELEAKFSELMDRDFEAANGLLDAFDRLLDRKLLYGD
jgi:hypothetical protein